MAKVADYSIIADDWVIEVNLSTLNFDVPPNIDTGSPSILGFMVDVDNFESLILILRLNGMPVWNWTYPGNLSRQPQFFQEVIAPNLIKAGKNVFSFESVSGDFSTVKLSDIVLWWQATI